MTDCDSVWVTGIDRADAGDRGRPGLRQGRRPGRGRARRRSARRRNRRHEEDRRLCRQPRAADARDPRLPARARAGSPISRSPRRPIRTSRSRSSTSTSTMAGISPDDAERLLVRPLETALKSIGNLKEMKSAGFEGGGYVLLEFEAGLRSRRGARRTCAPRSTMRAPSCPPTPTSRASTRSISASSR